MARARTWVRRGLATILLACLLAIGGVGVILFSETGARWALKQADARVEGHLEADGLSGSLWRGLQIDRLSFENEAQQIEVQDLRLSVRWPALRQGRIEFTTLEAARVTHRSRETGQQTKSSQMEFTPLPISLFSSEGRVAQVSLGEEGALADISDLRWSGLGIERQTIRAKELSVRAGEYTLRASSATLELAGDAPLSMQLEWRAENAGWSGEGRIGGTLAELQAGQMVRGPYPAELEATARWLGQSSPSFSATVRWADWEVAGYPLRNGTLDLEGVAENYNARYRFIFDSPEAGQAQVAGTANGNLDGLPEFLARIESPSGSAEAQGRLSWAEPWSLDATLRLSGLDPALFHPELAGDLHGTTGLRAGDTQPLDLPGLALEGTLNGSRFRAVGDASYGSETLSCTRCEVRVGANRLQLDGQIGEQGLTLNVELEAPELDELWPGVGGQMAASGSLGGTPKLPRFRGTASGQSVRFGDYGAKQIEIRSRNAGNDVLDLDFKLAGLSSGERELGDLDGIATGTPQHATVEARWRVGTVIARLEGSVRESGGGVEGTVRAASVEDPRTGNWALQAPAGFSLDEDRVRIEPQEWRGSNGRVTLERLEYQNGDLAIKAMLEGMPLQLLGLALPRGMAISGNADAEVDLRYSGGQWYGTVDWKQNDTVLAVAQFDGERTEVLIPAVTLHADLADGGANVRAALAIEPGVTGDLQLHLDSLTPEANIQGTLELQGREWDWLPVFVPQVDRVEGELVARFDARGPLRAPSLSGQLAWTGGSVVVPALNVPLTEIELRVEGEPDGTATVTGQALAGTGRIAVDGRITRPMQADRQIDLQLTGETAELLNWPEYHVWASPDMALHADRGGWTITGHVRVPRAEIVVEEASEEAVTPSPDVVVVGAEPTIRDELAYRGEIDLQLGEAVRVQAFGLDTRLEGQLTLRQVDNRPLRGEGRVSLAGGVFEAYGQVLTIEEGTLTFTGPLDNPLVDVRAVRKIESYSGLLTAGIHLTGRANAIQSTVYSEPALPEAEALSYLVLGQPLSQASSGEGSQLSGAALGLGLRHANRVTDQIGRNVGLDQLTLTGDGGEGTALVAGKQINARLHARYAYGVFSRLGTLLLRYRLSQRLTLEAATGENQSIDLLYTVEKY